MTFFLKSHCFPKVSPRLTVIFLLECHKDNKLKGGNETKHATSTVEMEVKLNVRISDFFYLPTINLKP